MPPGIPAALSRPPGGLARGPAVQPRSLLLVLTLRLTEHCLFTSGSVGGGPAAPPPTGRPGMRTEFASSRAHLERELELR
eukprot:5008882-Alexandrium_andersonii.AAC.1